MIVRCGVVVVTTGAGGGVPDRSSKNANGPAPHGDSVSVVISHSDGTTATATLISTPKKRDTADVVHEAEMFPYVELMRLPAPRFGVA